MMTSADIEYVFGRLDLNHVRGCAKDGVLAWLVGEPFEISYMPGDGTYYALLCVPLEPGLRLVSAPGGGTNGQEPLHGFGGILKPTERILVYWVQASRGFQVFQNHHVFPDEVHSAFPDTTPASALALAVLLNLMMSGDETWMAKLVENVRLEEATV